MQLIISLRPWVPLRLSMLLCLVACKKATWQRRQQQQQLVILKAARQNLKDNNLSSAETDKRPARPASGVEWQLWKWELLKGWAKAATKKYPKLQLLFIPKSLRQHHYLLCKNTISSLPNSPGHPPLVRPVPVPVSSGLFLQGSSEHVDVVCVSVCGVYMYHAHSFMATRWPARIKVLRPYFHTLDQPQNDTYPAAWYVCMCVWVGEWVKLYFCVSSWVCFSFTQSFLRHQLKTLKLIDRRDRELWKLERSRCWLPQIHPQFKRV